MREYSQFESDSTFIILVLSLLGSQAPVATGCCIYRTFAVPTETSKSKTVEIFDWSQHSSLLLVVVVIRQQAISGLSDTSTGCGFVVGTNMGAAGVGDVNVGKIASLRLNDIYSI